MGDYRYRLCRKCGRPSTEVGELSWTRQCSGCGMAALEDNALAMHERRGETWLKWRRAMAASVGALLVSDVEAALSAEEGP